MHHSEYTLIAIQAALNAGEFLRHAFHTDFSIESKPGRHNLVTECDKASEKSIISLILDHFPNHSILAEESGEKHKNQSDVLWIIDPLDGTVNFAHRIPVFSVSIAVAVNENIQAGVIYNPLLHELFVAEKDKGAHLNGMPCRVSSNSQLYHAFMATGFPYDVDKNPLHCIDRFIHMQSQGIPIRRLGSAALDLAYVACGRFDAFWEVNLNPWDSAAGKLLIEEAGGQVTDLQGKPLDIFTNKTLLATNAHMHTEIVNQLNTWKKCN